MRNLGKSVFKITYYKKKVTCVHLTVTNITKTINVIEFLKRDGTLHNSYTLCLANNIDRIIKSISIYNIKQTIKEINVEFFSESTSRDVLKKHKRVGKLKDQGRKRIIRSEFLPEGLYRYRDLGHLQWNVPSFMTHLH